MRLNETVESRDKATYLSNLVHDEWLEMEMSAHPEPYKDWSDYAAWLILSCLEQPRGMGL